MRLSFSSLACPGWSVEDVAAAAQNYGYEGIEWRLADGSLLATSTPDEVWQRIRACGVQPVCVDTSCVFVQTTEDEREANVRDAIMMAGRAAELGASAIRVFGGQIPDATTMDDVLGPARAALEHAADAVPEGVRVLVETHDAWSTGAAVARLVDGLDVGVLWDVAHTVRAGESVTATLAHLGVPELVHIKDARGQALAHLGEGTVPLRNAIVALKALGYAGWLSLEWEKLWHPELDPADVVLPKAAEHLRTLLGR